MITPAGEQPAEGARDESVSDQRLSSPQRYVPSISDRLLLAFLLTCGGNGALLAKPSETLDHGQANYR